MGPTDESPEAAVCVWCGHDISRERGVCQGCGSPITANSRIAVGARPGAQVAATRPPPAPLVTPAPRPDDEGSPQRQQASARPTTTHTARLVGLIVSAVAGGAESDRGGTGMVIRFFSPQGQLICEVRPGEMAYEEALRMALG